MMSKNSLKIPGKPLIVVKQIFHSLLLEKGEGQLKQQSSTMKDRKAEIQYDAIG